jgi:ubiquinone/menaquinone biosynthesis C-methylase UbiE
MYWCDAPIGSGRLMRELHSKRMLGFDISDGFLDYNRSQGIDCIKGDLFEFGKRFQNEFDIITSLHSIFAFQDYRLILNGFVKGLKPGGILIVDITNKLHSNATQRIKEKIFDDAAVYPDGMTKNEIYDFFNNNDCEILEIEPNDYWDNYFFFKWRYLQGNRLTKWMKKKIWDMLNYAYFHFPLKNIFMKIASGRQEYQYTKYLVAVLKKV